MKCAALGTPSLVETWPRLPDDPMNGLPRGGGLVDAGGNLVCGFPGFDMEVEGTGPRTCEASFMALEAETPGFPACIELLVACDASSTFLLES